MSSYHPQANGAVERMNHTLEAMLSMYVSRLTTETGTKHYITSALPIIRHDRNLLDIPRFSYFTVVNQPYQSTSSFAHTPIG